MIVIYQTYTDNKTQKIASRKLIENNQSLGFSISYQRFFLTNNIRLSKRIKRIKRSKRSKRKVKQKIKNNFLIFNNKMNSDFIIYLLIIVIFLILIHKKVSYCYNNNEIDFEIIHPASVKRTFY